MSLALKMSLGVTFVVSFTGGLIFEHNSGYLNLPEIKNPLKAQSLMNSSKPQRFEHLNSGYSSKPSRPKSTKAKTGFGNTR